MPLSEKTDSELMGRLTLGRCVFLHKQHMSFPLQYNF
jgi:hypothetical protein